MDIAAFIISIFAVTFAGVVAITALREQRFRLRAQVYIVSVDTLFSKEVIQFHITVSNIGLLPAKNLEMSPILQAGNITKQLSSDDFRSKAVLVPHQILKNTSGVLGQTRDAILKGNVSLTLTVNITYTSNRQKYFYKAKNEFNPVTCKWMVLEADAN